MSVLLFVLLIGFVAAQPHHNPEGGSAVTCPDCGGHGPDHEFPACLQQSRQCHHDEVCQIVYGEHKPEVRCHREHECHHGPREEGGEECPAGGTKQPGGCHLCCSDDSCVTDALNKITQLANIQPVQNVRCPEKCPPHEAHNCAASEHQCHENQYCQVTKDPHHGHIHTMCEEKENIHHCQEQLAAGHCDPHHHNCVVGCCTDSQCVDSLLGVSSNSSASQATTGSPQTTADGGGSLNTLTCGDIRGLECGVLEVLCPKLHCPDVCDPCFAPIVTVPLTTVSSGDSDSSASSAMVPQGTDPTQSGTRMTSASTAISTDEVSSATCEDTLENMSCSEMDDVCSSPLLATFCQKFCARC